MIDATEILTAARNYKKNRDAQHEKPWNKYADCQRVFDAMQAQGMGGLSASAGLFIGGLRGSDEIFVVEIRENSIIMGEFSSLRETFEV